MAVWHGDFLVVDILDHRLQRKLDWMEFNLNLEVMNGVYPLAQKQVQEAYLEEGNRLGIEYPSIVLNDVMDHEFIHGKRYREWKDRV